MHVHIECNPYYCAKREYCSSLNAKQISTGRQSFFTLIAAQVLSTFAAHACSCSASQRFGFRLWRPDVPWRILRSEWEIVMLMSKILRIRVVHCAAARISCASDLCTVTTSLAQLSICMFFSGKNTKIPAASHSLATIWFDMPAHPWHISVDNIYVLNCSYIGSLLLAGHFTQQRLVATAIYR